MQKYEGMQSHLLSVSSFFQSIFSIKQVLTRENTAAKN